ncbi:MAG: toprim domain-containing protein, partial [Candidatus Thermoplasmatota archaeon]
KLNIGNSISSFCENFGKKYKKAIILTDWDRKGGELCAFLKENFKTNSLRYDDRIRVKLSCLCAKDVKDVEGLKKFFEKLKKS